MKAILVPVRALLLLLVGVVVVLCPVLARGANAQYGRLSGSVTDSLGNPFMGATVLLTGPVLGVASVLGGPSERAVTDPRGKFTIERLVPGWYSLRVSAPTTLPVVRSGILVAAGRTAQEKFILSNLLAPIRFQVPSQSVATWSDDWKWVLRTSASTRPVLRYREVASARPAGRRAKGLRPTGGRMIAMMPGSSRREALASDPGASSVLAYLRSLSVDSDVLVAGTMASNRGLASSLVTSWRRNMLGGDPEELAVVVHQLNLADGLPVVLSDDRQGARGAQGVTVSYSYARCRVGESFSVTTGLDLHYLNAVQDARVARPRLRLLYRLDPSTDVAFQYGARRSNDADTMLERVGVLQAFPRVTRQNFRPRLEQLEHAEVSLHRRVSKGSAVELAVYRDGVQDAAAYGFGTLGANSAWTGSAVANPAGGGWVVNVGNYSSAGLRAAYKANLGAHVEAALAYAVGNSLVVDSAAVANPSYARDPRSWLRSARTRTAGGRVTARIPKANTQIVTSYGWVPEGRVTLVDPYGQADYQMQPYFGVQIRQPLPALAFLPARIEALADFRNLLAQGNVPVARAGEAPLILTSAYRTFRGGFSVQF